MFVSIRVILLSRMMRQIPIKTFNFLIKSRLSTLEDMSVGEKNGFNFLKPVSVRNAESYKVAVNFHIRQTIMTKANIIVLQINRYKEKQLLLKKQYF